MKRMIITLLVIILACTGCGNAVNTDDSKERKEDVTNENTVLETNVADINSEADNIVNTSTLDTQSNHENTDGNIDAPKEDVTNENIVSETNVTDINSEVKNIVDTSTLDTQPIYEITNGNTGKQITLNDSQQIEYMDALLENMVIQQEESAKSDAEKTMGYTYRICVLNKNGEVSKTITLKGSNVKIDGKYYIVESTENLVAYLDDLYK